MPDIRADSGISRRGRLSALVTSITLIGIAAMSTRGPRPCDARVRRLRARSRELVRGGPTAAGSLDDGLVPTLWPVRGIVSSRFGWRPCPFGGAPEWHPGLDITAPRGTPVRAAADGEVVFAGHVKGYGALVIVEHGLASTRYAHLSAIWVRVGEAVRRGVAVGALGGTGRATGPHLHFEVRVDGEPLDPACVLGPPAGIVPASDVRGSPACALARARLDHRRSRIATRNAVRPRARLSG